MAALAVGAINTFFFQSAFAQSAPRYVATPTEPRVRLGMEGAGGIGGTGGSAEGSRVAPVPEPAFVNRTSPFTTHVRSTQPPPLDPSRTIYEVDCTKFFNPLGQGNLRCM